MRVQERLPGGGNVYATQLNVGMEGEGEVKDWGQGVLMKILGPADGDG